MRLFNYTMTKRLATFLVAEGCDCYFVANTDFEPLNPAGSHVFLKRIPKGRFWAISEESKKYIVEYEHGLIKLYQGSRTDNVIRFFDFVTGLSSEELSFEMKALFEILAIER